VNDQPAGGDAQVPAWVRELGITDRVTGLERAHASWDVLHAAGVKGLGGLPPGADYPAGYLVFSGFLARAQGLHEGTVAAIRAGNPYATFTLLRAYAQTAAAVLYVKDHPAQLEKCLPGPHGPGVKIGKITSHAERRLGGFKGTYSQLSKYAHPMALTWPVSSRAAGGTIERASAPAFEAGHDAITACAWVVELAEATSYLLVDFAAQHGLLADPSPG
jgi:hypothetical protein